MRGLLVMQSPPFRFLPVCCLHSSRHLDAYGTFIGSLYGAEVFRWLGWSLVWLAVA